jgi:hypothetical protein
MRTFALAGFVLTAASSMEVAALEPCPSEPDQYREILHSELIGRAPGQVIATFLAMPSFAPEYGLVVSRAEESVRVTVVHFTESVWYGSVEEVRPGLMSHVFTKAKIKARKREFPISGELAALLNSRLALETARVETSPTYGIDGETYAFTIADGRCAETWSPDKGTRNELLVRTFEEVGELGKIPSQALRRDSEARLLKRLQTRWAETSETPAPAPHSGG